jgi:hypothetical protein
VTEPTAALVPAGFTVPAGLATELFVLEPLDLRHNESYDAVSWWLSDAWPFRHPDYAAR